MSINYNLYGLDETDCLIESEIIVWGARIEVFIEKKLSWFGLGWVTINWNGLKPPADYIRLTENDFFFFTLLGWEKYGEDYIKQLREIKVDYRIKFVDYPTPSSIVYQDDFQFAIRTENTL